MAKTTPLLLALLTLNCTFLTGAFSADCGDGFVQTDEACDDGNNIDGDGCSAVCIIEAPTCGNGLADAGEECDDSNTVDGDGCSSDCFIEAICGNGTPDAGEECDDGNTSNGDGCSIECVIEIPATCGDGVVEAPEECDDSNAVNGDGCDNNCTFTDCGNNIVTGSEECDDGNATNGDGCDSNCQLESCGDGIVDAGEECDDANIVNDDSCKNNCELPNITSIQAGGAHTCIISEFNQAKCWGLNSFGQLGLGNINTIGDDELPTVAPLISLGLSTNAITTGANHSCALNSSGNITCWGDNSFGRLGYGNTNSVGDNETPSSAGFVSLGTAALQVAAGGSHTCAILAGAIRCWGENSSGQLGLGDVASRGDNELPTTNVNLNGALTASVAVGFAHTCVILSDNHVRCWGRNQEGQLGYGNSFVNGSELIGDTSNENVQAANVGGTLLADFVVTGDNHTCALSISTNTLSCWGSNGAGQLGQGNPSNIGDGAGELPAQVNTGGTVTQITAGGDYTCALFDDGSAKCWGANDSGQLGNNDINNFGDNAGETPNLAAPLNLNGGPISQISAGKKHTCVLFSSGDVRCWGKGADGRLGTGTTTDILNPSGLFNISVF